MEYSTWGNASNKSYYNDNWYLYIISDGNLNYIGITSNLERRIRDHKAGDYHSRKLNTSKIDVLLTVFVGSFTEASKLERATKKFKNSTKSKISFDALKEDAKFIPDNKLESQVRYVLSTSRL